MPSTDLANPFNVYGNLFREIEEADEIDRLMGFTKFSEGPQKAGWLINMHSTLVRDPDWAGGRSAVDLYFIQEDGSYFKATFVASQYMYVVCKEGTLNESEQFIRKKLDSLLERMEIVSKQDLDLPNHLAGLEREVLKLVFRNINDLNAAKKIIQPIVLRNANQERTSNVYENFVNIHSNSAYKEVNCADYLMDLREHDLPVHLRISIDFQFRVGLWYQVTPKGPSVEVSLIREKHVRPDPVILAFDIETSKQPLKFPDSAFDPIIMISYMIDGQGYLITNREIVSQDISDFEYSPKPEYPGSFTIFNEPTEERLLIKFFEHIQAVRPTIFVTYNGDFFDWPYINKRASIHGMEMEKIIGFSVDVQEEYKSKYAVHMDAFKWVKRDSYLPAGSQGLKAVTSAKLGYDPIELDPELMVEYAQAKPQVLASYSVSDAVATYFLYLKYVHPFVFSLCNIIPLNPDEVLRKGSGTLCESLLMAEASKANILMPNKTRFGAIKKFHNGHLLEEETYIGGHVEALESGVFRSDIPTHFRLSAATLQKLSDEIEATLAFTLQTEMSISRAEVVDFDKVKDQIKEKLHELHEAPSKAYNPAIYHLDVAAMYPNIILTNRLQPHAIVSEAACAACDFNKPGKTCQRKMPWSWRGEFYSAKKNEYKMIVNQLESEQFKNAFGKQVSFAELTTGEKNELIEKRLKLYCRKVYKKIKENEVVERESIVCQKENSFYIDTVRSFRDRRYEYKGLNKSWKGKLEKAVASGNAIAIEEAKKMNVIYDSLQLAHKCILNSFYGYVMRKGSRWFSMEMAGIVCENGSKIIQLARTLVERIGRPLELDTDGIWCIIPDSFPDKFDLTLANGKKTSISYLCSILNFIVHEKFTNDQYHTLTDPKNRIYKQSSENSIFFELDGPYHAMILPASTEENKLLKKRYAVFNFNGTLAELKGFEIKRRGELKLIKIFQSYIFKTFLQGSTLMESYESAAKVVNYWLDILYSKGEHLNLSELVDLICENRNMSRSLDDYGEQKSTCISTAKRLAEFLGDEMVKDKGLSCRFIITTKPIGDPVASRAVPIAIFSAEPHITAHYLRKWLKDPQLNDFDIRTLLDWNYYLERFEGVIQKLITIPAAMQGIPNPVPRIKQPAWVLRRNTSQGGLAGQQFIRQAKITDMFAVKQPKTPQEQQEEQEKQEQETKARLESQKLSLPSESVPFPSASQYLYSDYGAFIKFSKLKWKRQRSQIDSLSSQQKSGLFSGFNLNLVGEPWFIAAFAPVADLPGVFKFWLSSCGTKSSLVQVKVSVQRKFYINSRIPDILPGLKQVYYKMPRSFRSFFLYEWSMGEEQFLREINIEAFKTQPDIDAIYESTLPLSIRALIQVGDACKISPADSSHLDLNSFEFLNPASNSNFFQRIPSMESLFSFAFLFQMGESRGKRQFFAYCQGASCLFVVVDPSGTKNIPSPRSTLSHIKSSYFQFDSSSFSGQILVFKDVKPALKSIFKFASECKRKTPYSSLLLAKTQGQFDLERGFQDFLICKIPFPTGISLPSLDWQRAASKRFGQEMEEFDSTFSTLVDLSRYSHIPVTCLIEVKDAISFITDIIYARALKDAGHLLWYSPTDSVDIGGRELDWLMQTTQEHVNDVYLSKADYYRTICFELDVSNLYLNTILASSLINELEACNNDDGLDESNYKVMHLLEKRISRNLALNVSLADNQHSKSAFQILKSLFSNLYKEALVNEHAVSVQILQNFDAWFCSPASGLYDSLLMGKVKSLAKKLILQLCSFFREHGAEVVFASCDKFVLTTRKVDVESAMEWMNFIIDRLKKNDLYLWLHLSIKNAFQRLIWFDNNNFYGEDTSNGPIGSISLSESFEDQQDLKDAFVNLIAEYSDKFSGELDEIGKAAFSGKCFDLLGQTKTLYGSFAAIDVAKKLFAFIGVDSIYSDYHISVKKSAFMLLGLSEFSSVASFTPQDEHVILIDDFVCPQCFCTSTLCASIHQMPKCIHCDSSASIRGYIETFLMAYAAESACKFYSQDFACLKCRRIKVAQLDRMCKCSGLYCLAIMSGEKFALEREILTEIAQAFEMQQLFAFLSFTNANGKNRQ